MAPIPLKDRTGDVRGPWRIVELAPERFRVVSETGRVLSTRAIWRAECLVCGYRTEHIWQCLPRHCPECKRLAEEQEMMEAFDAQRRGVPCPSARARVARLPRQPRNPPRGPRRLRNGPQAPRHNERRDPERVPLHPVLPERRGLLRLRRCRLLPGRHGPRRTRIQGLLRAVSRWGYFSTFANTGSIRRNYWVSVGFAEIFATTDGSPLTIYTWRST